MNQTVRRIYLALILIILIGGYLLIIFNRPEAPPPPAEGNVNYLSEVPVIPDETRMTLNEKAPDFEFFTIDGEPIHLASYIGEKHVILDFWSLTCAPCIRELPVLQEFYEEYGDEVEIIAITDDSADNAGDIRERFTDSGAQYPAVHDYTGMIARLYPTRAKPYIVYVNIDGIAIAAELGEKEDIHAVIKSHFGLE